MVRLRLLMAAALLLAPAFATAAPIARPTPERSQTLLFDAAKLGRADLVPALVVSGADVNGRDAQTIVSAARSATFVQNSSVVGAISSTARSPIASA